MKIVCKELKLNLPRTKYLKWKRRYISYSTMRRKTNKRITPLTRALLHLLKRINKELDYLEKQYSFEMPSSYYKRRTTIKKINRQQQLLFTKRENPKNRIVSIDKDYLRPIVIPIIK